MAVIIKNRSNKMTHVFANTREFKGNDVANCVFEAIVRYLYTLLTLVRK